MNGYTFRGWWARGGGVQLCPNYFVFLLKKDLLPFAMVAFFPFQVVHFREETIRCSEANKTSEKLSSLPAKAEKVHPLKLKGIW